MCSKKIRINCEFCNKDFSTQRMLNNHLKAKHLEKIKNITFDCDFCGYKTFNKAGIRRHMKLHTNGKSINYVCDFDAKIFNHKGNLYRHMRVHMAKVKCKICQSELKIRSFRSHMKECHSTELNFTCKICPLKFKSQNRLQAHESNHNKRYECSKCGKKFRIPHLLKNHDLHVHQNILNFECEICGRKVKNNSLLKLHKKSHDKSRSKPYKCQRCKFSTDRKQSFMKHVNYHEKEDKRFGAMINPLKCTECTTLCKNKRALRQHKKIVHSKIFFQCDLCAKNFKVKGKVLRHMQVHKFCFQLLKE